VNIGLIGKYVELKDAYKSINEALVHGGVENEYKVNIVSIQSEKINTSNVNEKLSGLNGILVAPGFGGRGIEGKLMQLNMLVKTIFRFGHLFGNAVCCY